MSQLASQKTTRIADACRQGAARAAAAWGRALGAKVSLEVGQVGTLNQEAPPEGLDSVGLLIVLKTGEEAVLVALPEAGGLCPSWPKDDDSAAVERLLAAAQEFGCALLSPEVKPDGIEVLRATSLSAMLASGGLASEASHIALVLTSADDTTATGHLVWPASTPSKFAETAEAKSSGLRQIAPRQPATLDDLPPYVRSLLRIKLPVKVTLASRKQDVGHTLELAPGAMIQFDKPCEDLLELQVGNTTIGVGEAVKVGDKFGLRVMSLKLPAERFRALKGEDKAKQP